MKIITAISLIFLCLFSMTLAEENMRPSKDFSKVCNFDNELNIIKNGLTVPSSLPGIISLEQNISKITGVVPFPAEKTFTKIRQLASKQDTYKGKSERILEMSGNITETLKAGEHSAFAVDTRTKSVRFIPPLYKIADVCYSALEISPKWLRDDLLMKFRDLSTGGFDELYANLILKAASINTKYVDETAFLVTYIASESLRNARFRQNIDWLIEIPEFIYRIEDSLKYVRTIERGDYASGEYYTTTEYRIKNGKNGEIIWSEIPAEIYYWYIVHPKIYQEGLWTADNTNDPQQRTYGYSWHNYYWNNPSPQHDYTQVNMSSANGSVKTIPRFGELMQKPDILWDREKQYFSFGREFQDGDHALNLIGNWGSKAIPADPIAGDPRAIHPNQVLKNHRGRCGEDSYLIGAACRTALIPIIHRGTHREDHVWGAVWDQGWNHFEFFRGGLAVSGWGWTNLLDKGGYEELAPDYWVLSFIEGHRPDCYVLNHTSDYTETCNLRLGVMDRNNVPADGINIRLYSAPGHNSESYDQGIGFAGSLYTDYLGFIDFKAGDRKKFYFQFYHPKFGYLPSENQVYVLLAAFSQPNGVYDIGYMKVEALSMPVIKMESSQNAPDASDFGVNIKWSSNEIISTQNITDSQKSTFNYQKEDAGNLSFFILDSSNYINFTKGISFNAYEGAYYTNQMDCSFGLPDDGLWYIVFSNGLLQTNNQRINVSCDLYENHSAVTLLDMEIKGKDETLKESFEQYECEILLSDGTKHIVSDKASWDFVYPQYAPAGAYFDGNVLYTGLVNVDSKVEIMASYNFNHLKPFTAKKTITIKSQTSSVDNQSISLIRSNLSAGPNPLSNFTNIKATIEKSDYVTIKVINKFGEIESILANKVFLHAGSHEFIFDSTNLAQGIYFCVMDNGKSVETVKLVVIK